jgi:hypothetical protein
MARLKFVFLCLVTLGIVGYACKKEPVDSKVFVERYLVGRWQVNTDVELEIEPNNDTTVLDTLYAIPTSLTDTARIRVSFTEDQRFLKGTDVIPFAVDEKGEKITFSNNPDSTWFFSYVRAANFKVVYTRSENTTNGTKRYIREQVFAKTQ